MSSWFARAALAAFGALVLGNSAQAAPPDAVGMIAGTCVGCHGANGTSRGTASPTIAGMAEQTFIDAMKGFQDGSRPATVMGRIAKGYTEEEIKGLAGYFGKMPFGRAPNKVDAAKVKVGKSLHNEFCKKCHADNGKKDEDGSNVLAGQWLPYLKFAMEDFTGGKRKMEKKMKAQVEDVQKKDPNGLEALMHFYASQK